MRTIYYLHGYQTSGEKFKCLQEYYKDKSDYKLVYWEWDEFMDIPAFIIEKIREVLSGTEPYILMADSMGCNIAWTIVNYFPQMQYVMSNPVFSPDQILDQTRIEPELRSKIYETTAEKLTNKNARLIISSNDESLDNTWYKKVFNTTIPVLELEDEHSILKIKEYMPLVHQLIEDAFKETEKK